MVEGFAQDGENLKVLTGLRAREPELKILVSVGGWTWSGGFSDAVLTPESRRLFVESAVHYVRRHDLDGFDVDWEYPGLRGYGNVHRPEDQGELHGGHVGAARGPRQPAGAARGRHYLLTFAAGAFPDFLAHIEMDKVQAVVDFVNLMTYDFREAEGEPRGGTPRAPLSRPGRPRRALVGPCVREFLAAGVPPHKLVLGVPFYGRVWGGVQGTGDGLWQPGGPPSERLDTSYGALAALVGAGRLRAALRRPGRRRPISGTQRSGSS